MLGDRVGEARGRVTGRRVLASDGAPRVEVSFESKGSALGVDVMEIGTYWSEMRAGGVLYGEGQGVWMSPGGDSASWRGGGVGRPKAGGAVSYRGAIYFQASGSLARLDGTCTVFEFEVDEQGNTHAQLWEWK